LIPERMRDEDRPRTWRIGICSDIVFDCCDYSWERWGWSCVVLYIKALRCQELAVSLADDRPAKTRFYDVGAM